MARFLQCDACGVHAEESDATKEQWDQLTLAKMISLGHPYQRDELRADCVAAVRRLLQDRGNTTHG